MLTTVEEHEIRLGAKVTSAADKVVDLTAYTSSNAEPEVRIIQISPINEEVEVTRDLTIPEGVEEESKYAAENSGKTVEMEILPILEQSP
ncbi:hypothetical protein Drorol1_Dr00026685 [Drosera rotundifolia]